mgnify:CR=1 FL=1
MRTDWKQLLRDVLKDAKYGHSHGDAKLIKSDGTQEAVWEITLTDERMKELEELNLWSMGKWGD